MEEWKFCFEDYEISNFGNCRRKGKIINGSINNCGYKYFQVNRDGKRINKLFHHSVAECFIGERPIGLVCDHIDRNKLNNNVSNLRYITQLENSRNQDRYRIDITEIDPYKRKLIMERLRSKSKCRNLIRKRGQGGITKRPNGTFQAIIKINDIRYNKTFKRYEEAEKYLTKLKEKELQQIM